MTTFDPTKPVRTRDGRPARIVCTDRAGAKSLVSMVMEPDGYELIFTHYADGAAECGGESDYDLINIPERHVRWVNVYQGQVTLYCSKEGADYAARDDRIACVRIEFEEGEGL